MAETGVTRKLAAILAAAGGVSCSGFSRLGSRWVSGSQPPTQGQSPHRWQPRLRRPMADVAATGRPMGAMSKLKARLSHPSPTDRHVWFLPVSASRILPVIDRR